MNRSSSFLLLILFNLVSLAGTSFVLAEESNPKASVSTIKYWYRNFDSPHSYALLEMALRKTEDIYGPFEIQRSEQMTQGRAESLLKTENKYLDIASIVPSENRIKDLRAIYIALEEGLVGHRVCIIKQGSEGLFKDIRTVSDLKEKGITIGQGTHWPDTQILQDNLVDVVTNVSYEGLFGMLEKNRFSCYLRGANEVLNDIKQQDSKHFTIEPNLLFVYPSTSLFFVNKQNIRLATRIELGLRRGMLDGELTTLFKEHYSEAIEQLDFPSRRVIKLNNSLLSDAMLKSISKARVNIDGKVD